MSESGKELDQSKKSSSTIFRFKLLSWNSLSQTSIYVSWLPSAYISNFKRSPRPFKLPPPQLQQSEWWLLEVGNEANSFASAVVVRFGVWNTNCWDLLCKSYLLPLTVSQIVKANQPLRWDVDTNSRSEAWLSARPQPVPLKDKRNRVLSASERNELRSPISNLQRFPESFCSELCSPYFQPPKVPRTFGASRILVFIEY